MGARFEALDEAVLAAASKSTGYFFAISISQKVRWGAKGQLYHVWARFKALDERVLAAASKSIGYFFAVSISQKVRCVKS